MNLVFLSPQFPPNYVHFCVQLKHHGVRVLGIGDTPYELLQDALREALTEYYRIEDMENLEVLQEACRHFIRRYGPIQRIESHNEHWLGKQAELRETFDVSGVRPDQLIPGQRKSKMKAVFSAAGIPTARGLVVPTKAEAEAFLDEVGYPVVAKPDRGVGAAGTYKIRSDSDLRRFFEVKPPVDYLMEEFLDGTIYTFDGLTDRRGKLVFHSSLTYSRGVMETVNTDDHIFYTTLRKIPADLEALGRKTLAAFGVTESFFHFEYFRLRADDRLIALEVNLRPPGGPTLDMYNWSSDVDLYDQWAQIVSGKQPPFSYDRSYHCCFVGRKWRFSYRHDRHTIEERFQDLIIHHLRLPRVFSRAMGDESFILRSADLQEVLEAADFIQAR